MSVAAQASFSLPLWLVILYWLHHKTHSVDGILKHIELIFIFGKKKNEVTSNPTQSSYD